MSCSRRSAAPRGTARAAWSWPSACGPPRSRPASPGAPSHDHSSGPSRKLPGRRRGRQAPALSAATPSSNGPIHAHVKSRESRRRGKLDGEAGSGLGLRAEADVSSQVAFGEQAHGVGAEPATSPLVVKLLSKIRAATSGGRTPGFWTWKVGTPPMRSYRRERHRRLRRFERVLDAVAEHTQQQGFVRDQSLFGSDHRHPDDLVASRLLGLVQRLQAAQEVTDAHAFQPRPELTLFGERQQVLSGDLVPKSAHHLGQAPPGDELTSAITAAAECSSTMIRFRRS